MAADFLSPIDWSRPWLAHISGIGQEIAATDDWRGALDARADRLGLCNHQGFPVRFVPQADLPAGVAYETFIYETGGVPTRENLHDFFNALVWLTFPRIKIQLNALQAAEIARANTFSTRASATVAWHTTPAARGKLRDAATIFDENAVLFASANKVLVDALRAHDWQQAFLDRRDAFAVCSHVALFGHALMEKLVNPYKSICGHMWVLPLDGGLDVSQLTRNAIDAAVAGQLESGLTTANFSPLPILGVPGWWEKQDAVFYADPAVFRPRRNR